MHSSFGKAKGYSGCNMPNVCLKLCVTQRLLPFTKLRCCRVGLLGVSGHRKLLRLILVCCHLLWRLAIMLVVLLPWSPQPASVLPYQPSRRAWLAIMVQRRFLTRTLTCAIGRHQLACRYERHVPGKLRKLSQVCKQVLALILDGLQLLMRTQRKTRCRTVEAILPWDRVNAPLRVFQKYALDIEARMNTVAGHALL